MIIDANNVLSDGQAITASAVSTNVIDLGAPGTPFGAPAAVEQDIGKATEIPLAFLVQQAFNTLTSLQVDLQVSSDNSTFTTVVSRTYLLAELVVGSLPFPAEIPVGTNKRFMRLNYTVNGSNPTTGKLFAAIVAARQSNLH